MFLLRLAWKNLWRNKWRTVITVMAVAFAVIFCTAAESLKQGIFDNLIKNVVSFYTGVIQVHQKGYYDEPIIDNSFALSPVLKNRFEQVPGVIGMTLRLESFALVSIKEKTKGCLIAGILPGEEQQVTLLRNRIAEGGYLTDSDRAVLIGEGLARQLGAGIQDTVVIFGQGYHGSMAAGKYPIRGILHFGSPSLNDRFVALPLSRAMELFDAPGMSTGGVFSISDHSDPDAIAADLRQAAGPGYEVMTWEQILPDIKQHIETDSRNMRVFQFILYFLISFGILSTLIMMMVERKYETGMLIAIGMQKSKLVIMFMYESVLTVFLGCLLGILASLPLVYYLKENPLRISGEAARAYERFGFEPVFPAAMHSGIFLTQALTVCLLGLLLSLYPVFRVMLLKPLEAMKK